jgi:trehalose 6-phosphate phosphatase
MMNPAVTISKSEVDGVIFDLDGVVTRTAIVHAAAWKRLFDEYLEQHAAREGASFQPFDADRDYRQYVDGKPRYDGVVSFLESRGISLAYGQPTDPPDRETVCGLGNRKNQYFLEQLREHGVDVYQSTVEFIHSLRARGIRTAIISASKNCAEVLKVAGISELFNAKVDGVDADELGLAGKPNPAVFLEAARRLGLTRDRVVVVEDAIAGVQAGRDGHFGLVVGVNRSGRSGVLKKNGADVEIADLSEVAVANEKTAEAANPQSAPPALECLEEIRRKMAGKRVAVFLDYDGTLTPIVDDPDKATLPDEMRSVVRRLARHCRVAVISGRDLEDVRKHVGLESVFYAGSHGFDMVGPGGWRREHEEGERFFPALDEAGRQLDERLSSIPGARIERKKFAIAVHYRKADESDIGKIEAAVDHVLAFHRQLRKSTGKKIYELRPRLDWDKGKAVLWLLGTLGLDEPEVVPLYIGDDVTDEDAFRALEGRGIGILVRDGHPTRTAAAFSLRGPDEVQRFLEMLISELEDRS